MKTVKVADEFYTKIEALASTSGSSIVDATSEILGAGLGELEQLGNELKEALRNEEIKVSKKPSVAKKVEGKVITKADITEAVVEEKGSNEWIWVIGALIGAMVLKRRIERNSLLHIV